MTRRLSLLLSILIACASPGFAAAEPAPNEPDGYRIDNYHAPTPETLEGAEVLTTAQAVELWKAKAAIFIDALARPPKPEGLPKNVVWRDPPRKDIPGSIWLANVGFGELAASMEQYFEQGLARATEGDKSRPLVFYCRRDCWASWNAAKRALTLGYRDVFWYRDGTTGWEEAGQPLELREPEPLTRD
jgi:PQQ-dependent catabolism-associated CXXCW motif protein